MFRFIDNLLNRITMYRLVLYYLIILWAAAFIFSIFGILAYEPFGMAITAIIILCVCWLANVILAGVFEAPVNVESVYITALILMLILTPIKAADPYGYWVFLVMVSLGAIASKFILAIGKKHVFNPAAFGVALVAFAGVYSASWWLGTAVMLPFVLVGGLLIVRKLQRSDLAFSFILAAFISIAVSTWLRGFDPFSAVQRAFLHSPIFFFAFVMITEPLTTPPTRALRIIYGCFVGALFSPAIGLAGIQSTPELALLVGNVFSYLASPKTKMILKLKEVIPTGTDLYDFVFTPDKKLKFKAGQYLEWTLGHDSPDSRGNRRYFTIASAPSESDIRMGVKFYPNSSTFKKKLAGLSAGDVIVGSQLAGEFTLPKDKNKKLVFIAGGIGVTPFRSMVKNMLDTREQRDVVMFYSARTPTELAYRDIFDQAVREKRLKMVYTVNDAPAGWRGLTGYITADMIMREAPDCARRFFYISGPRSMVVMFEDALKKLGVPKNQIKTDFFPGFV